MRVAADEHYALEARAEALAFISADAAVRRGQSDRFEIGRLASSDAVDGQEAQHTGGAHAESAHAHTLRAVRLETRVGGKMSLKAHSDTTLLGGAMAETHVGPVLLMAGMSDALVAGGGVRVSLADLAVAGLIGFEEKIGSAFADGALVEAYATHFEREFGAGNHVAGFASFTGTVHVTSASGFRPLFKVATGVRNLTAGGGGGAGPEGPAGAPAQAPPPQVAPPTGRPSDGGLIGDTPEVVGIYSEVGDLGDVGTDAARALDGAADAEDLDDYAEVRDVARVLEEPQYDYADVGRGAPGQVNQPTGAETSFLGDYAEVALANGAEAAGEGDTLATNGPLTNVLAQAGDGSDAARGGDTADILGNLRASAQLQDYEDGQRGAILNLLNDLDSVALTDDVDRPAVIARLQEAQIEASRNAVLAAQSGEDALAAAQNDIAQLYGLARTTVENGNDPQSILDRLAAIYRWRAQNDVEAYANQADAVADIRASVEGILRDNGYRAGAVGTDEAVDADTLARLQQLFDTVDETTGATDEVSLRIDDASDLLSDLFDDIDDGAASTISPESTPGRDPRDLTVGEIDAYRSDGEHNWLEALSSSADRPSRDGEDFRADVPLWNQKLEQYDDGIVGLLTQQQAPALGDGGDRAALLEDLRSAEATAAGRVERANVARNAVAADVAFDQLAAIQFAADAVERGEDPLSGLNDLVETYRWRNQAGLETYADQVRIFEDVRDDVALIFRNNQFDAATELANPDFLSQAQDLFNQLDRVGDASGLDSGADATLALENADDLADNIRPDLIAAAADDSDAYSQLRWQGPTADADSLADLSTDDVYSRLNQQDIYSQPSGRPDDSLYSRLNRGQEGVYSQLNRGEDAYSQLDLGPGSRPGTADNALYQQTSDYWQYNALYGGVGTEAPDDFYESIDLYESLDLYESIDDYATVGPPTPAGPPVGERSFPFVPPRLQDDVDVGNFADFIRAQRDDLTDPLTGLPPTGGTPADAGIRAQRDAYDLALDALQNGDDPLALIDDRVRSARLRQASGTPLIENEVEILSRVRQTLAENFDSFRDGTGPLYDYIAVDNTVQVDQLRVRTQAITDSTAGGEAAAAPGAVVDDFVRTAEGRPSGLGSDVTTRPPAYEEIDLLDDAARNAPVDRPPARPPAAYEDIDLNDVVRNAPVDIDGAAQPVYSDVRQSPRASRPVLPADPSRSAPPAVLRFNSDDPVRFGGILGGGGPLDSKPFFRLTDAEFELAQARAIEIVITDVDTLQELPNTAFGVTGGLKITRADQADLASAADLSAGVREAASGRSQSLPALQSATDAAQPPTAGLPAASPPGLPGSPSVTPPVAGGVTQPRPL